MRPDHDRAFLCRLARRYFIDGETQQAIAHEFGYSRQTISSLIRRCREEGIVDIRIVDDPNSPSANTSRPDRIDAQHHQQDVLGLSRIRLIATTSKRITDHFPLERVVITPLSGESSDYDYQTTLRKTSAEAASLLASIITSGMRIGITWGETMYHVVQSMPVLETADVHVVQLTGETGAFNPVTNGYELAKTLAGRLHGTYHTIPAPIVVKDVQLHELLTHEPSIAEGLAMLPTLDAALIGIHEIRPYNRELERAGFVSPEDSHEMIMHRSIGHLCGYQFDAKGLFPDLGLNKRIVGIALEDLRKIPQVIAVACGQDKLDAISAALRTGVITTLVTDELTAVRLARSV